MRDFELERYFSKWEFTAQHHMTASDMESMALADLLAMANDEQRQKFQTSWLGYSETWGALDLRQAIADSYNDLSAENILCMAGAGEGIYATMRVLLEPGDHVVVPVPNYQSAETVPLAQCDVSGVPIREGDGRWVLDLDDIKSALRPETKLLSLNFPHNPTGMCMGVDDFHALIELCRERGIYIFSDEVYRGVELNTVDQLPQIADVYEKGISLNVLSKAYGLPGLRLGWLASQDRDILEKVERYKHYLSICNAVPAERLGLIALQNQDRIFARNKKILKENLALLDQLWADFPGLFSWYQPQGGCVAFVGYEGPDGVEAFCKSLIEDSGIMLLPSSIYRSDLVAAPDSHFRIGFGRDKVFKDGLTALRGHLEARYSDFKA